MEFRLHEIQKDGTVWNSDELQAAHEQEIRQRVIAGYTGLQRWATVAGNKFYAIDAKGKAA